LWEIKRKDLFMEKSFYAVYGASGFGREVLPIVRISLVENSVSADHLVFIDDGSPSGKLNGHNVMTYKDFLAVESSNKYAALAISNSSIREKLANRLLDDKVMLLSVSAKNTVIMDNVHIGEGYLLSHFVCLTSNIKIGLCFHGNIYSYVAHDCVIGDFVTFGPNVQCNGNVVIEDHAYIGTGAVIKQGQPNNPLSLERGLLLVWGLSSLRMFPHGQQ